MTSEQYDGMIAYLDAMNQSMVDTQRIGSLILFFVMIGSGFLIGYIVGKVK
jgi:hypothetical protein